MIKIKKSTNEYVNIIDCRYDGSFKAFGFNQTPAYAIKISPDRTIFEECIENIRNYDENDFVFILDDDSHKTLELKKLLKKSEIFNYQIAFVNKEIKIPADIVEGKDYRYFNLYKSISYSEKELENVVILDHNDEIIFSDGGKDKYKYFSNKIIDKENSESILCQILDFTNPRVIEEIYGNYYKYNKDLDAQKEYYRSNLLFDELDKFYVDNIESYLLDYAIYLPDTGRLNELIKLAQDYDLESLVNIGSQEDLLCKKVRNVNRFIKKGNNLEQWYIDFPDAISNKIYRTTALNIKEAQKQACQSKEEVSPMLMNYILVCAIQEKSLTIDFAKKILSKAVQNNYNQIRKKHIACSIFDYLKINAPHELKPLLLTGQYNHVQSLHFLLSGVNFNEFYPGICRVERELNNYNATKIMRKNKVTVDKGNEINILNPKVAICISGATRYDVKKLLELHKETLVDKLNADVFIATWDSHEIYPGLTGPAAWDKSVWLSKHFVPLINDVPADIKILEDFRKKLPTVAKKIYEPEKVENSVDTFQEVFPNCTVSITNEQEFEEMYNKESFITRENLNQAKMFYGIWKAQQLVKESDIEYDYTIRVRIDYTVVNDFTIENLLALGENELALHRNPNVGPSDIIFGGSVSNMDVIASIWENAVNNSDICPIEINGEKACYDSHKLMESYMADAEIIANTANMIVPSNAAIQKMIRIPDVTNELNKDLVNVPKEEHDKYIKFFEKLYNYNR